MQWLRGLTSGLLALPGRRTIPTNRSRTRSETPDRANPAATTNRLGAGRLPPATARACPPMVNSRWVYGGYSLSDPGQSLLDFPAPFDSPFQLQALTECPACLHGLVGPDVQRAELHQRVGVGIVHR